MSQHAISNAAKTDVEVKEKALLSAQAQTGAPGDRSKANEIRARIDKYQDEIFFRNIFSP